MGLSASQGRMLLLTARKSDLEFRAQQISQKRMILSQQLEEIAVEYENATSNRQMKIGLALSSSNNDEQRTTIQSNLTYAALVSGTLNTMSSADSGITGEKSEYASNICYRLVDVNGAIVVSSIDEISGASFKATTTKAEQVKSSNGNPVSGLYRTTNTDRDGNTTGNVNYLEATGQLGNLLGNNAQKNIIVDPEAGVAIVKDSDGSTKYYSLDGTAKGDDYTYDGNTENQMAALLVKDAASKTGNSFTETSGSIIEGGDGVYTVTKSDGTTQRYVVDTSLKRGLTDGSGDKVGPNYLQDCIRNGKYLIQRGTIDTDSADTKKVTWKSIEWDAASNISDSYYTEDDDKAKAKYDRLQTQIQAQDKKLELELNEVETQRSATSTEMDSVKKVISDNVEKTFKTFA